MSDEGSGQDRTDDDLAPDACESCGRDDEPLVLVRRLYITPESWDTPGRVEVADEEWWCFVCRTHYPHQVPGGEAGEHDWPEPTPPDAD